MKTLERKNIIITGAASGIGKLMATKAAKEKANCALIDINEHTLKAFENELGQINGVIKSYVCDISDYTAVETISALIRKDFGSIDVLINNAGIVKGKSFVDLSIKEMHKTMDVNFWGHIYFTKQFLPDMLKQKSGTIVNIASSGGFLGMVDMSDYCASKFANVGFSETLRRELRRDGHKNIKVTCVCPYIINTGMFNGFKPLLFNPVLKPEKVADKVIEAIKKGKPYVIMPPFMVRLMLFLKLFPTPIFDWILRIFGASSAMEKFSGRH